MWHWTTRTGEYAEAVAFTRREAEPEPAVTDSAAWTAESTETATGERPGDTHRVSGHRLVVARSHRQSRMAAAAPVEPEK